MPESGLIRKRALQVFVHPAILLSLLLLGLNDHVFKQNWPSALTGKLSDFAGLFFFPYLLVFFLSLIPGTGRLQWHQMKQGAFALTAIVFSLLKLSPVFNAAFIDTLYRLIGIPLQFVVDPTDILALLALIPSWRLIPPEETNYSLPSINKLSLLVLVIASFLTLGTSPAPYEPGVYQIEVIDGQLYAGIYDRDAYLEDIEKYGTGENGLLYVMRISEDDEPQRNSGKHESVSEEFDNPPPELKMDCSSQSLKCFRIEGDNAIELSLDRGVSWARYWKLPSAAESFIKNHPWSRYFPPLKIYDFSVVDTADGPKLYAAVGSHGIIIVYPSGEWTDISPDGIGRTPIASYRFFAPSIALSFEPYLALTIAVGGYIFLSTKIQRKTPLASFGAKPMLRILLIALTLSLPCLGSLYWFGSYTGFDAFKVLDALDLVGFTIEYGGYIIATALLFLIHALLFNSEKFTWSRIAKKLGQFDFLNRLISIGIYFGYLLPFGLWSGGLVTSYLWAHLLALCVATIIAVPVIRYYVPRLDALPDPNISEGSKDSS